MRLAVLVSLGALALTAAPAHAIQMNPDGYYQTGQGIRHKKVGFVNAKVYQITSEVKQLPPAKSKQAMIELNADKKLTWKMLRKVDSAKIQNALREAYAMNGYRDQAKIDTAVNAFSRDLPKGSTVTIAYDAPSRTTTISTSTGGRATIPGDDFMRATWSIW